MADCPGNGLIPPVLRIACFRPCRRLQDAQRHFADAPDSEFARSSTRQIELAIAPIGSRVVDPQNDGLFGHLRPDHHDRSIRQNGARRIVGALGKKRLARRCKSARIEAVLLAAVVVRRDHRHVAAHERLGLGDRLHPVAGLIKAVRAPGALCLRHRRRPDRARHGGHCASHHMKRDSPRGQPAPARRHVELQRHRGTPPVEPHDGRV